VGITLVELQGGLGVMILQLLTRNIFSCFGEFASLSLALHSIATFVAFVYALLV
jgi:hypothetical protein